jgi:hypothetical protein
VVLCIGDSGVEALKSCVARAAIPRDAISLQYQIHSLRRIHVRRFSHLADSDIGGPKGKSFSFASKGSSEGFVAVHLRGQVAEIKRSRELGSSQGKGPSIGYSKSRGARTRRGKGARGS